MATDVMTLREYADLLTEIADEWDRDEEPVVLIGDVTGSVSVSSNDGHSTYGSVGYAHECFDGNGVFELGEYSDKRFFGTMIFRRSDLDESVGKHLDEPEEVEA